MAGEESFELSVELLQAFELTRFTLDIGSLEWNFQRRARGVSLKWPQGSAYPVLNERIGLLSPFERARLDILGQVVNDVAQWAGC